MEITMEDDNDVIMTEPNDVSNAFLMTMISKYDKTYFVDKINTHVKRLSFRYDPIQNII